MPARGCRRDRRTAPPLVGVLIDTRAHARRTRPPRSPRWYYTHGCVIFHTLLYFYALRGRKKCIFFRPTCTSGRTGKSRANLRVRIKANIVIFQSTVASHAAIRVFNKFCTIKCIRLNELSFIRLSIGIKFYSFEMSFRKKKITPYLIRMGNGIDDDLIISDSARPQWVFFLSWYNQIWLRDRPVLFLSLFKISIYS